MWLRESLGAPRPVSPAACLPVESAVRVVLAVLIHKSNAHAAYESLPTRAHRSHDTPHRNRSDQQRRTSAVIQFYVPHRPTIDTSRKDSVRGVVDWPNTDSASSCWAGTRGALISDCAISVDTPRSQPVRQPNSARAVFDGPATGGLR